jgi:hypothetical protein
MKIKHDCNSRILLRGMRVKFKQETGLEPQLHAGHYRAWLECRLLEALIAMGTGIKKLDDIQELINGT